jgi:hypothetical protein
MLDLVRLEIVLILMRDSCTVCAECTTGSAIILDAPEGDEAQVQARRTIASKLVFDTPDGTPR